MKLDSDRNLRHALVLRGLSPEQHRQQVEQLAQTLSHGITFVAARPDETCASYALRLTDDPIYRDIARDLDIFAGKDFMTWATSGLLHELAVADTGCLVCYFSPDGWHHVGVMNSSGQVTSKWGTYPLYEHGLAEVSEEYGDTVRFFERPTKAQAMSLFLQFARAEGLSNEDIADICHDHGLT